ncbi:MAG TPA: glycosyltransferase family 2 protein [Patescibacteria group bacterium]|nr:glycosyltransferase family 2 protein [Patescibacteria group bacterium]
MKMIVNNFSYVIYFVTLLTVLLVALSVYVEYKKAKTSKNRHSHNDYLYKQVRKVAVLIASKNGEKTIVAAVRAARANRYPVYVVSDGSTDNTAKVAKEAGARVLSLRKNIGKPSALHRGYKHFKLSTKYDAIAILDDDVIIEKDFIRQAKKTLDRDCAIAVGKNLTVWPDNKRWNIWLASRTYSYWAYQITMRTIQSTHNVMSCISGSNSLYRTEVLDKVLTGNTPYIVDDTFWTLETHRLQLGTIKYAPKARAWLQDPTNFKDWYKQNLRWMWGTFQGILGHRIGTKANKFHMSYLAMMLDWLIYIFTGPLTLFIIWQAGLHYLPIELLLLCAGYSVWVIGAALSLKMPRLILFIPAIIVTDFLFRWIMVHGLIKALKQRTVEACVWDSPMRFESQATVGVK